MKQSINKSQFRDAFAAMGRKDQFSYEALGELYDYLDSATGDGEYDLDVIEICCEWCEATLEEVKESYPDIESFDGLEDHTIVIRMTESNGQYIDKVIYAQY